MRRERGFTLVELMVVVAIIGILATVSTPTLSNALRSSNAREGATMVMGYMTTARDQAMARGEVVLMRIEVAADGRSVFRMYQAPPVNGGPARAMSCSQITLASFAAEVANSDGTAAIGTLEPLRRGVRVLGMTSTMVGNNTMTSGASVSNLCFSPDGRSYYMNGNAALPVQELPFTGMGAPGAACRGGFTLVVTTDPNVGPIPGDTFGLGPNTFLCATANMTQAERSTLSSLRDTYHTYLVELTYSGMSRIRQ